jgi:hypothetical protein
MAEGSGTEKEVDADTSGAHGQASEDRNQAVDSGRRNFARAGLAAPVLFSIVNRTAWAGPACAPSAFMSTTFASHNPDQAELCDLPVGCSPGFWMNHPCAWPGLQDCTPDSELENKNDPCPGGDESLCYSKGNSKFLRNGTTFKLAFGCDPDGGDQFTTMTEALEIVRGSQNINFHAVAALLNAKTGQPNYNLTPFQVKEIFCTLIQTGEHLGMAWSPFWEDYFTDYECTDNGKDPNCEGFIIPSPEPGKSEDAPGKQNK